MAKITTAVVATMVVLTVDRVTSSLPDAVQNVSSGSASAGSISDDAGVVEFGYQIADVSGAQACGGEGFNYSRYWVGPMPDGATKLNCISGYRCEAQNSSPIFWCKQYALPLNAKCGGYLFYTLFKCIDGTACIIDPSRYEPRCLSVSST